MSEPESAIGPRRSRWTLALIAMLAILARGALISRAIGPGGLVLDDPDNYLPLARSLAEGQGFALDGRPTAYRPPLYPLLLAPIVGVMGDRAAWGVAGCHLALGALTVVGTAATARRWGLSERRALVAAGIVALDPVLVAQGRSVMTETLAAALSVGTFLALSLPGLRGATLGGVGFGLSALCRPSAWPALGLTALAAAGLPPGTRRERLSRAAILVVASLVTVAPWMFRNAWVIGEPIVTTTHGGYTLYLANNHVYYDEVVNGPPGAVWTGDNQWHWWDSANRMARGLGEPEADRLFRREALAVIAERPRDFARATAARLGRFWGVAPSGAVYSGVSRLATALWTVPFWIALAAGLAGPGWRRWPRVAAPVAVLALTCVHAFYWTDMRMRATIVPASALVAASALAPRAAGTAVRDAVYAPEKK